jgi:signal transduction histidine kinase/CheY-like chemotaxis protein
VIDVNKTPDREKVERIIEGVMKVASGDLSVQIEISGKYDHFDALAMGINMMIDDLRNKYLTDQENEEIKETNLHLEKAKQHAIESERLKSAFLANMSHEIRTPMNGILGFAELLKDPKLTGEQQHNYISIIEKSGIRMLNIINDIVDISKIESNLITIDISEVNINEQIEYIYTFFNPEASRKGLQLSINNGLPSLEALVQTDKEKLYAILTNLVKNAIKYTKEGTIDIGYKLKTDRVSAELEFYVNDTGIGIAENKHHAIFDRFIQAEIMDRSAIEGTGLGLAITKSYVEMLQGKIWIESEVDKGSTFYFTIPYHTLSKEESQPSVVNITTTTEKLPENLKVLIVEDDEVSEQLITIMICPFCSDILKARTGLKAVEVCRNNPDINLILMDIRLPEMDGYRAVEHIRQFNKETIIIGQSAYGLAGDREKAIEAGCNDYLTKPIVKEDLLALIQKYSTAR